MKFDDVILFKSTILFLHFRAKNIFLEICLVRIDFFMFRIVQIKKNLSNSRMKYHFDPIQIVAPAIVCMHQNSVSDQKD